MQNPKKVFLRLSTLLLALILALTSLAACTKDEPVDTPPSTDDGGDTTPPDDSGDNTGDPAPEITYLSNKELAAELSSSLWKSEKLIGNDKKYGLSDPSAVGVDKERFENEVLYPIPSESEFDKIYDVTEHGVSTENDGAANSAAINAVVELAKAEEGLKYIYFPAGTYKLSATINLSGVKDTYFGGEDIHFVGTTWFSMFSLSNCENLHFNGFTVEFDPTPAVSGKILSYKHGEVVVKINEGFDISNPIYAASLAVRTVSLMEFKYDELTGRYVPQGGGNGTEDYATGYDHKNVTIDTEANTLTFHNAGTIKKMAEGTVVNLMFTNKVGTCFNLIGCKNTYWEDVTIYSNPGMGFVFYNGENAYVNNMNITHKPNTNEIMTTTSDGFHTVSLKGELHITNSSFLGCLDDCLNIKTRYHTVLETAGNKIIASTHDTQYNVGDVIEIFKKEDLSHIALYEIIAIESANGKIEFTVDREVEGDIVSDRLANTSRATKLKLDNCLLGNKRNRGILVQCRDSIISNCTFVNLVHAPVVIHSVCDQYGEAIVPKNITVENNKFIGSYFNSISTGSYGSNGSSTVIDNITIRNNFFANSDSNGMILNAIGSAKVENNMFYNICLGGKDFNLASNAMMAIYTGCSKDIIASENLLYTDEKVSHLQIIDKNNTAYTECKANFYLYGDK